MKTQEGTEQLLLFLNTWEIPNHDRKPTEHLQTKEQLIEFAKNQIGFAGEADSLEEAVSFRNDIRKMIESGEAEYINDWIMKRNIQLKVKSVAEKERFFPDFISGKDSLIDLLLANIFELIFAGAFHRVKICPDCKWAFFDHSKSGTKKWCSMNINSPSGRACGTIAKVRRFRNKEK
ncbi:CGNR zinc finger domain-containing protein [Bacillus sp. V3-13]|uniref:CGNR zinc finger domain-containing protein n=1 Tax=Bacillus sp. V3-13 TaxID=2053728 RepID=UPI0015E0783E|nr:CGNR zinc finger domain-containing protein [Bacillus sp. V3-13]